MFVLKTLADKFVKGKKQRLYVAFVDFKKAYDTINRGKLFQKLKKAQIGDIFLSSLRAMYSSVQYCVKMTNGYTDPIKSFKGLKQGCVLSPILFNMSIDDIESIFTKDCHPVTLADKVLNHLLYADDLILISKSPEGLQNCLNRLDEYCQIWDLNVNIDKSKTIIFNSSGRVLQNHIFLFRKKELEIVQDFTYLGITFSSSASFKKAYQTLGDKACKAMHPLVDAIFKFNLTVPKALDLFEKLVQPILLYGSEVWASFSPHQLNSIPKDPDAFLRYSLDSPVNKPKLKFCKQILGLKRNSSSLAVYGELGIIPTALLGIVRIIKFWHRISHLNDDTLVKKALNEARSLPSNISNWFNSVKLALDAIGLSTLWNDPSSLSPNQVNRIVKDKIFTIFHNFWKSELTSSHQGSLRHSKLRTYKTFKSQLKLEKYLSVSMNFKYRKTLCKFRCSDHTLLIETGRHKRLDVNDRICKNCTLGLIEDEIHFLLVCPAYETLRTNLLLHTSVAPLTTDLQFQEIMSSNDGGTMAALALYLVQANDIRETLTK